MSAGVFECQGKIPPVGRSRRKHGGVLSFCFRPQGVPRQAVPPKRGRKVMPRAARLHMRWIYSRQRPVQSKLRCVHSQPLPNIMVREAINARKIDGAPVAITAGRNAASVEGITRMRFETSSDALTIIVTKPA